MPLVSVIIPVYNGENYLQQAIDSVLAQSLRDFELIVIDDGSTDATPRICQDYGSRIRSVRQGNGGAAAAFNHGIHLSNGKFLSWLSHDDVYRPRKLEEQHAALAASAHAGVCYCDLQLIDAADHAIGSVQLSQYDRPTLLRQLATGGEMAMAAYSLFFEKRCVEAVGLYDEHRPYTQDAEMLLRLARRFPFVHVPQQLMSVREHPNRGVHAHSAKWEAEAVLFYRQASLIPLDEFLPKGSSRRQRGVTRLWFAREFAQKPFPFSSIGLIHLQKAIAEDPRTLAECLWLFAKIVRRFVQGRLDAVR